MSYFLSRWVVAIFMVAATYNPTGISFLGWVERNPHAPASVVLLIGFVLCFGFAVFVRGAIGAIGYRGILLLLLFFGLLLWVLVDVRLLRPTGNATLTWAWLLIIATVLAIGVSWSHLRKVKITFGKKSKFKNEW